LDLDLGLWAALGFLYLDSVGDPVLRALLWRLAPRKKKQHLWTYSLSRQWHFGAAAGRYHFMQNETLELTAPQ
jgi:hypothetical protein